MRSLVSLTALVLLLLRLELCLSSQVASNPSPTTSYRAEFTVPSAAGVGATLLPNILDPSAKVAQDICPGYRATDVKTSGTGLTATLVLAGKSCNAYGTDIGRLSLLVEYQTDSRLHVAISPSHVTAQNESWYVLSTEHVPAPSQEDGSESSSDLAFSWTNSPSFGFNVTRKSTRDVLFSSSGHKLVFENQFIEFVTSESPGYNLYGLGEVIHGLRMGNNFTRTIYAADVGDPIDTNLYGSHPFALQTKYFETTADGKTTLVTQELDTEAASGNYTSASHGVYLRNAHGMEILMHPTNVTWRTIGGNIDLYFFSGPTQPAVTQQYLNVIGMPTLQQYWGFGYHQCR